MAQNNISRTNLLNWLFYPGEIVLPIAAIVGSFAAPLGGVHEMIRGIIIALHSDQPINSLFTSPVTPWSI